MRPFNFVQGRKLECEHESETLSAVYTSRWPHAAGEELRAHVAGCRICSDVVAVAAAFEEETDRVRAAARVPDASIVWWRAQLRARQEANREVLRPITVAQAIGLAAAVGVMGAIFGATATWFQDTLHWMWSTLADGITLPERPTLPEVSSGVTTALSSYAVVLGVVALVVGLASLAVYFAVRATESDA